MPLGDYHFGSIKNILERPSYYECHGRKKNEILNNCIEKEFK